MLVLMLRQYDILPIMSKRSFDQHVRHVQALHTCRHLRLVTAVFTLNARFSDIDTGW